MKYEPTWNSLKRHVNPQWLRDAKFGIYTHWGIYSVPAAGPNVSWYPQNMYTPSTEQYKYHLEHYGPPEKFGYKDFIPQFTGERFDADEWAEIFHDAGAKFAGPVGEHHDGFCLWNTRLNEWNSVNKGPKRDVVGELEKAIRAKDMKYMVALHHAENWFFYPHWMTNCDVADPKYSGLYGDLHNLDLLKKLPPDVENITNYFDMNFVDRPSKAFLDMWLGKVKEVVDFYTPDLLWFDFGLEYVQENYRREMLAYYYNAAEKWGREVAMTYKWNHMVSGTGIEDIEQGSTSGMRYNEWITDTTVDDGCAWGYMKNAPYKSSASLIRYLVDNVSKNGYMLLNVGPKPDGTLPEEAKDILKDMGKWLRVNGEAVYGTTPWLTYGEGPTKLEEGAFKESSKLPYTAKDIRYTCKGDVLYATLLNWPSDDSAVLESAKQLYPEEVASVTMLGCEEPLPWKFSEKGLEVGLPKERPCDAAYVLKIQRKHPFNG